MFDTLLKPKFYNKCKSCLKLTKMRLDSIRKKKNAVVKFLKNDIADLLRNGLDYNAYGRAEGLLVERNILSCYNMIDEFYGTISNHFALLNKQRECPGECREAVASMIYAAARFADLPELRDLRNLFTERFGNCLEAFTNKELLEKSRTISITKEMKLQLMQEIAQEFSIEWNSKALEQQLYTPPPPNEPEISPASKDEAICNSDKTYKAKVSSAPWSERKTDLHRRKDISDDDSIFSSSSEDNTTESTTRDSSTDQDVQKATSEDEADKPFYHRFIPPPYRRPKPEIKEVILEKPLKVIDEVENDEVSHHYNPVPEEKPKPKSVRRRNLKPPPGREIITDGSRESTNLNRIKEKDKDPRDGEEMMLDGLLMHYSKKKPSYEPKKANGNLKNPRIKEKDDAETQSLRNSNANADDSTPPARTASLPTDLTSPSEAEKRHIRTGSLQPDIGGHVHPKLPDYDQLAARFSALRGK